MDLTGPRRGAVGADCDRYLRCLAAVPLRVALGHHHHLLDIDAAPAAARLAARTAITGGDIDDAAWRINQFFVLDEEIIDREAAEIVRPHEPIKMRHDEAFNGRFFEPVEKSGEEGRGLHISSANIDDLDRLDDFDIPTAWTRVEFPGAAAIVRPGRLSRPPVLQSTPGKWRVRRSVATTITSKPATA